MKAEQIKKRILSSGPFKDGSDMTIAEVRRWCAFRTSIGRRRTPGRLQVRNAMQAMVQAGVATKVSDGVIRRSGASLRNLAKPWRNVSNEELEIEPLLSTSASTAAHVVVMTAGYPSAQLTR